ncbi:galactosylceramide sulfotransferase-like [Daphnia carinata]|uniref:galactosylceramide sulfotransferase-like n=1 Tax=Daphnia carinata TaxID=120202 RepID=UPI002580285C|nr:galactosylceramide sulfotransferase-like [Daphnia carinata]
MIKLNGHFGSIRGRFSVRHLFLFSASALLVIVTYRPYSNNNSAIVADSSQVIDFDRPTSKECRPTNKIAFMKTHKCASSTIENILFRHALRENLNVAMPLKGNYLSRTELFNRSSVLNTPWGGLPVDIFTLHNRWHRDQVMALMGPTTFAFSVVRDPVDQFESLYNYMSLSATYKTDLKGFVRLLRTNQSAINHKPRGGLGRFGRNQIAFDWGVSPKLFGKDPDVIRDRIHQLDDEFELVLIAERMEESLVLLADRLCWPLEYVTHLDLNVRKPERTVRLEEDERHVLGRWLNFDTDIYEHFCRRFDDHVARFNSFGQPDRMEEQVRLLRQFNLRLRERCVIQRVGNEKLQGKFLETHNDTFGYLIRPNMPDCDPYAMSEPAYLSLFREKLTHRAKMALKRNSFVHAPSIRTK